MLAKTLVGSQLVWPPNGQTAARHELESAYLETMFLPRLGLGVGNHEVHAGAPNSSSAGTVNIEVERYGPSSSAMPPAHTPAHPVRPMRTPIEEFPTYCGIGILIHSPASPHFRPHPARMELNSNWP